jgi:hypothetical protein
MQACNENSYIHSDLLPASANRVAIPRKVKQRMNARNVTLLQATRVQWAFRVVGCPFCYLSKLITACTRVLPEKLLVVKIVKILPSFNKTKRIMSVFTTAPRRSRS